MPHARPPGKGTKEYGKSSARGIPETAAGARIDFENVSELALPALGASTYIHWRGHAGPRGRSGGTPSDGDSLPHLGSRARPSSPASRVLRAGCRALEPLGGEPQPDRGGLLPRQRRAARGGRAGAGLVARGRSALPGEPVGPGAPAGRGRDGPALAGHPGRQPAHRPAGPEARRVRRPLRGSGGGRRSRPAPADRPGARFRHREPGPAAHSQERGHRRRQGPTPPRRSHALHQLLPPHVVPVVGGETLHPPLGGPPRPDPAGARAQERRPPGRQGGAGEAGLGRRSWSSSRGSWTRAGDRCWWA